MTAPEILYVTRTGKTVLGLVQLELPDGSHILVNPLNLGRAAPTDRTTQYADDPREPEESPLTDPNRVPSNRWEPGR